MVKKLTILALIMAVVFGVSSTTTVSAATHVVNEGESIQDAIDAADPGDTIQVGPGVFTGQVNVNKSLTIVGAKAGVDARSRATTGETILRATSLPTYTLNVTAPNVVIDGFTFDTDTVDTGDTTTNTTVGVALRAGADNAQVINSIFTDNGYGIRSYAPVSQILIQYNLFDGNNRFGSSHGVFLNSGSADIEVSDNVFRNTASGSAGGGTAAVQVYGATGQTTSDVRILRNTSTNDGTFAVVYRASGVVISDNTSTNQHSVQNFPHVLIDGGTSDVTISGNNFSDGVQGIKFGTLFEPTQSSNVTIEDNTINGMSEYGIWVMSGALSSPLAVTNNAITSNGTGIQNDDSLAVNANNNWWGCAAGPGSSGCDTIDGIVVASVWYVDDSFTETNLDGSDAPGVPNTSGIASYLPVLLVGAAALLGAASIGFAVHRIRTS